MRVKGLAVLGWLVATPLLAFEPGLDDLDSVPLNVVSAEQAAEAMDKAESSPQRRPLAIAAALDYPLGLQDGVWTEVDGQAVWRSQIYSSGATLLALRFHMLALPADAELRLYDPQGALVQGPYRQDQIGADGQLWTAYVRGEQVVLDLRVGSDSASAVQLQLSQVFHGYRDPSAKSGSCNIDVVCSQGDDWSNEIRSTVRTTYQVGNSLFLCTGSLVNNAREDSTPYLLSAHHCGFDTGNDQSLVTYFNYETSSCGGNPNGDTSQTVSGATFLDSDPRSDFALLRLNQNPPSSFDAYLAGWNVDNDVPQSGVTIHHPSGDEKRISVFDQSLIRRDVSIDGQTVSAWEVVWSQGTTEQGSSGAGIWDQDRYIVGVLSGGDASCNNLDGEDYYGRLELAWENGLSAYLDPDDSGTLRVDGRDLQVSADNDTPNAVDDDFAISIGGSNDSSSYSLDVLSNDTDPDGDALSISAVDSTNTGELQIDGDLLIYTPDSDFEGTASFSYTISDGNGGQDSAAVSVSVTNNTPPPSEDDDDSGGGGAMPTYLLAFAALARLWRYRQARSSRP